MTRNAPTFTVTRQPSRLGESVTYSEVTSVEPSRCRCVFRSQSWMTMKDESKMFFQLLVRRPRAESSGLEELEEVVLMIEQIVEHAKHQGVCTAEPQLERACRKASAQRGGWGSLRMYPSRSRDCRKWGTWAGK